VVTEKSTVLEIPEYRVQIMPIAAAARAIPVTVNSILLRDASIPPTGKNKGFKNREVKTGRGFCFEAYGDCALYEYSLTIGLAPLKSTLNLSVISPTEEAPRSLIVTCISSPFFSGADGVGVLPGSRVTV